MIILVCANRLCSEPVMIQEGSSQHLCAFIPLVTTVVFLAWAEYQAKRHSCFEVCEYFYSRRR